MFTKRIIPCLDVKNARVVKGVNFVNLKDAGDPVEVAKAYDAAGADEVVFLDITASSDQRATVVDMVRQVAPHPSHLSAYRGFFGCRHFSQTNEFLRANGLTPIDWQIENIPAAGNRTDAVF